MKFPKISQAVVRRMPIYLRYLNELNQKNIITVSSRDLGGKLGLNPAQIRKDLAYFGEFGKKGIGYDVSYLIEKIKDILKLNQTTNVAIVGAGNLGRALCNYNVYLKDNMKITAIFDNFPEKVGEQINNLRVKSMEKLREEVKKEAIKVGIITVPANEAQHVAEQFVEAGVKAILNFAPIVIKVPSDIKVHHADFTTELQSLAYYLD